MKKWIVLLLTLALLAPLGADAAKKKVLYITSNGGTATTNTKYSNADVYRIQKTLGYAADKLYASDTTAVQAAFTSGDYGVCIPVNVPDVTASFDTHAEIEAAGWGNLDEWIDPNHPNHAEIPIIFMAPSVMVTSGVWATAYTGVVGAATVSGYDDAQPLIGASGDSFYVNCHFSSGIYATRVADSVDWCDAIIWNQTAVPGSSEQKYALIWRTVSTGGYPVYYMKYGSASYLTGHLAALIGAYVEVTPVEITIQLEYGYTDKTHWARSGGTIDTIGSEYCMDRIIDYVIAHDMKMEIILDQTMLQSDLKDNMTRPINRMILHPENFKLTHWTLHSARSGNADWFSALGTARTASQMANAVSLTQTATAADTLVGGYLDNTRCYGYYNGAYAGGFNATALRVDSVLDVIVGAGITDIITSGNSYNAELPPYSGNYGIIGSMRTWIGPDYTELRTHAICRDYSGGLSFSAIDSQKVAYMARFASTRGTNSSQMLKYGFGTFVYSGGTVLSVSSPSSVYKTALFGTYSAGYHYGQGLICGGSNTGGGYVLAGIDSTKSAFADCVLTDWYAQVNTMNDIATRYGTMKRPVFIWQFADKMKHDRMLERAYCNSHVRHE